MKSTPISAHGFQLTRFGLVNCYLVREAGMAGEPDSFTLIDTGVSGTADGILAIAKHAGAAISRILLTHAHVDHVGSVDALAGKLGTPGIAASTRSLPLLQQPPDTSIYYGEANRKIKGGLPGIKSRVTHEIADGELFGSLRCIATPGHIPGHVSYLDERDGTLYAGDALVGVGRLSVSGFAPWYFPLPNLATWDKAAAVASARKLLDFPIQQFACGHGAVRTGGSALLKDALAKAGDR